MKGLDNMLLNEKVLKQEEKAVFRLRSLYQKYGYSQYKMSKFEEYDLYVRNKDFLVSDSIITFNDTSGKLLALKPDVTLSIIKNSQDSSDSVQRVYYNESVYRISKGSHSFKEIVQAGLECIGCIDTYNMCEVILLAAKSLQAISSEYVLDISHMGFVSGLLDKYDINDEAKALIVNYIGEKNLHDIKTICDSCDLSPALLKDLTVLIQAYGNKDQAIEKLSSIEMTEDMKNALYELDSICKVLDAEGMDDHINIDFSIVNDMNYYNGIVFKGYIEGIPASVLSGGRYDKLMHKMGKDGGAIGFAVYLDSLERLEGSEKKYDVDTVILYDESADPSAMMKAVKMLTDSGTSVMAEKKVPEKIKFRQLLKFNERGFEILENND
ncbi:MAG: ATP phosphoribosyltransferase regulatory subunit [Firmicutes bacterium]|nr:ATP phosphoribosyltransferase regulatory subunit [Bacillota bacterium]